MIVYNGRVLKGWQAVLAVLIAFGAIYVLIFAFATILTFFAIFAVVTLTASAIYRLFTGRWPVGFR